MTRRKKARQEAERDLLTYLVTSPSEIADFDAQTLGKLFTDPDICKAYEALAELPEATYEAAMQAVHESGSEAWPHLCKAKSKHGSLKEALADWQRYADPDELTDSNPDQWQPKILTMSDVTPRSVDWLWHNRIARGRLSLVAGRPGLGKSFLTCDVAASVSTGRPFPDGQPCEVGDVLILNAEDDPADTVCPRLLAHDADLARIHVLQGQHKPGSQESDLMVSCQDLPIIEDAIKQHPNLRLIVIDPIGSFLGSRIDAHRDNEVRNVLGPIGQLAEKYDVAVLIVAHPNKSTGGHADDSILGSRAFTGIVRNVWHLAEDYDDNTRRLLLSGKTNLGPKMPGLAFTVKPHLMQLHDGRGIDPGRIQWETDAIDKTADEHFAEAGAKQAGDQKLSAAAKWLQEFLTEPQLQTVIVSAGERQGFKERTLQRAAKSLELPKTRTDQGLWQWEPAADSYLIP